MERNPYIDRIFTMAAHLKGAERTAAGIALIMTEAQTIAMHHPGLKEYITEKAGPDWMAEGNYDKKVDGSLVVIAFFEYMRTGALKSGYVNPDIPSSVSVEA